jgi:lysophospholipase L1-like esterase
MADLKIAVLGDSAMWGQGLVVANKYWLLSAGVISQRLGRSFAFADSIIKPHSGAKIKPAAKDADDFVETYPEIFQSDTEKMKFLDPEAVGNEEPSARLFGDIPRTFPTISYQVKSTSRQQGEQIDLLYLNGGINDLDFETFLNPKDHEDDFRKTYDPVIRKIFFDDFRELVRDARDKFPNALIVVPGYFTPFNPGDGSDFDEVKKLLLSQAGVDRFKLALNWIANFLFGAGEDIPAEIRKVKRRAQYGNTLGLYWMRKAIADLNEDPKVRGVGLIFVPSGIKPVNAVFRGNSFFHEEYEVDKVHDRLKEQRISSYPRSGQIAKIRALYFQADSLLKKLQETNSDPKVIALLFQAYSDACKELLALLKGPNPVIYSLIDVNPLEAFRALGDELSRFTHVSIASFLHPNEKGAQLYADNIVARFDRHHQTTVREDFVKLATSLNKGQKPQVVSVKDCLKRYGLDARVGLRACMQHMMVDSLAVRITTRSDSDQVKLFAELSIDPAQPEGFALSDLNDVERVFKPGRTDLIPLDTFGELHLSMIKQTKLILKQVGSANNPQWKPSEFTLIINGKEVFTANISKTLSLSVSQVLAYPG